MPHMHVLSELHTSIRSAPRIADSCAFLKLEWRVGNMLYTYWHWHSPLLCIPTGCLLAAAALPSSSPLGEPGCPWSGVRPGQWCSSKEVGQDPQPEKWVKLAWMIIYWSLSYCYNSDHHLCAERWGKGLSCPSPGLSHCSWFQAAGWSAAILCNC